MFTRKEKIQTLFLRIQIFIILTIFCDSSKLISFSEIFFFFETTLLVVMQTNLHKPVSLFFSNCWNLFGQNLCIHSWTGIVLGHGYENYILPWYTCSMSATKLNDITQRYSVILYRVGREKTCRTFEHVENCAWDVLTVFLPLPLSSFPYASSFLSG